MKALLPKNVYGLTNAKRGLLAREKRQVSAVEDRAWMDFEKVAKKFYGRDTGSEFMRVLRAGEFDAALFWTKIIGIRPLPWQLSFWNDGLMKHPNNVARGSNSLGKTVGYGLFYFKAGTYRHWAPEYWGTYSMRHLGPLEEHAMKTYTKMDEALRGIAREQAYRARRPDGRMGWLHRPNLLSPFIVPRKIDRHEGFDFFGGSALLTFTGTAQGAKSSDGSDPYCLGYDEVRHETNFTYVHETIIVPRYLRTPDGRLVILYTPDAEGAAIELGELYRRGQLGRRGWYSIPLTLDENKTVRKKDRDRVLGDISKRIRGQVERGEEAQPKGAFYAKRAIDRMFFGTEPAWLDELGENRGERICSCSSCDQKQLSGYATLRQRVEARCPVCQDKRAGKGTARLHVHPLVAFIDPASSAEGADGIVFMVADLEPPGFDGMEVVYAERIEEGSAIGDVIAHANAVAGQVGDDEVGYDRKGAFGHAFEDESYEVEGNFVGVQNDSFEQKTRRLDFVAVLADKRALRVPENTVIRAQMTHYKRKDTKIAQDFVMCLAGLCEMAKPYLPDRVFETEPDTDKRDPEGEDVRFAGMGDDEAYSVEDEDALIAATEVDD